MKSFGKKSTLIPTILYMLIGAVLLIFPSISATVFCWGLGGVLIVYGLLHLYRFWQAKQQKLAVEGELAVCLLLCLLGLLCISAPRLVLSLLPFLLGGLLLVMGLIRIPAVREAFSLKLPGRWLFVLKVAVPLALGIVLLVNPFGLVTGLISFFGLCLMINGILELLCLWKSL